MPERLSDPKESSHHHQAQLGWLVVLGARAGSHNGEQEVLGVCWAVRARPNLCQ